MELLDAVPDGEVAMPEVEPVPFVLEPVELPVELPLPDSVALPETEPPVPVAPIELVPLVLEPGVVVVSLLAVPELFMELDVEPVVVGGVVDELDELVDGVEPGVVLVVEDVVLDSRFVQAPSERAATTARAAADAWVRVIFIRKLLERFAIRRK